jgi:hypothetical protein
MPIEYPEGVDPLRTNPRATDGDRDDGTASSINSSDAVNGKESPEDCVGNDGSHHIDLPEVPRTVAAQIDEGEAPKTPGGSGIVTAIEGDQNEAGWFYPHSQTTSPNLFDAADIASEVEHGRKIARLHTVIKAFDPGTSTALVEKVIADLHKATNGEEFAFGLLDWWLKGSSNYPGEAALRLQWAQLSAGARDSSDEKLFRFATPETGTDMLCHQSQPEANSLATTTDGADPKTPEVKSSRTPNVFDKYSLLDRSTELAANAVAPVYVMRDLAYRGQSTAICGAPNTGKTQLTTFAIAEAITSGVLDPSEVYYLNVDDSSTGLAEKSGHSDELRFNMLAEGHRNFSSSNFSKDLKDVVARGQAKDIVLILDTGKHFADLMNKRKMSQFTKSARAFTMQGGTLLFLAHVNKRMGPDGKPIVAGTADLTDDFDAVYTLSVDPSRTTATEKVVVFECVKRRGDNAQNIVFSYTTERGITYAERLASVKRLEDVEIETFSPIAQAQSDDELIATVQQCILGGERTKMKLAESVAKQAGVTKRRAVQILEKYTRNNADPGHWSFNVRERGAKEYVLNTEGVDALLTTVAEPAAPLDVDVESQPTGQVPLPTVGGSNPVADKVKPATPKRFKTMSEMDRHG